MSKTTPTASSSPSLDDIINDSLTKYEKETKESLRPLMDKLKDCKSTADILAVFHSQVEELEKFVSDNELIKLLNPIADVLFYASSSVIGAGVGLVYSPANVIFAGTGVLLSAANGVSASHDTLIEIFERIGYFFNRLEKYTDVPKIMVALKEIIVETMVEVLEIFAIVTKEINQGRAKGFSKDVFKKLIGRMEIKLRKLDRLTQEEVDKVISQTLEAVYRIDGGVVAARAELKAVGSNVSLLVNDEREGGAHEYEKRQLQKIEESRRLVRDRKWLSPPDPSINHNLASDACKDKAKWFLEGDIIKKWESKSTTSFKLLWIYGKPGSGKSIICSSIINDIAALQRDGQATMAYFYFDFKDTNKQNLHGALRSLLAQLSYCSDNYCDILVRVYQMHSHGTYRPSTRTMVECLKEMLKLPDQRPVYIILDALDECPEIPETPGSPSPREEVLDLLKDLVGLLLSNIHICVTSRPESDIESALKRLPFHSFSIHDEPGQKQYIEDYIKSVVYAKSNKAMGRWRDKDREMVIETLTERADGMFRWVYCQLEVLQRCLPQNLRRAINEMPRSLDETYERVLMDIGKANRGLQGLAHRLLRCITVAIRPLSVDELTEILALDEAEGDIPKVTDDSLLEDRLQAVQSTCSSLVTVVNDGHSRVIQFSHFSVKEFLTSNRLASSTRDVSHFHIVAEPAHATLAQACLRTLLQLDGTLDDNQVDRSFPLATYASQHWVVHAQFGTVSSWIKDGIRRLFDTTEPYFAAWLQLHDLDDCWTGFGDFAAPHCGSPLYYASLCGFRDIAAHIIDEDPEQVNARGGYNHSPLAAALYTRHFNMAKLLRQHGADMDVPGVNNRTPLQAASVGGHSDVARWLLESGADPNSHQDRHGRTALHLASSSGETEIVRLLIAHGANANAGDHDGRTPLHLTWTAQVARLLLDIGASADVKNKEGRTVFQVALRMGKYEIVQMMIEHGAQVDRGLLDLSQGDVSPSVSQAAVTG